MFLGIHEIQHLELNNSSQFSRHEELRTYTTRLKQMQSAGVPKYFLRRLRKSRQERPGMWFH